MVDQKWRWIVSSAIVLGSVAIVLQLQLTTSKLNYLTLLLFFFVGVCGALFLSSVRPGKNVNVRLLTLRVVRASVGLAIVAGAIWGVTTAVSKNLLPPLPTQWEYFLISLATAGVLGYGWRVRRGRVATSFDAKPFKAQADSKRAMEALATALASDAPRRSHLQSLQRIHEVVTSNAPHADILAVVEQEIVRMQSEAKCAAKEQEKDMLDAPAALLEWAVQKLPEITQLDTTDLHLARAAHAITSLHSTEKNIFVDHRQLLPIHPIDRGTANDKCNERAECAKKALPIIHAHHNRLSEALIHGHEELAPFESVTGIQVVNIADPGKTPEYVTFEGNGRREALSRAFGGRHAKEGIEVEVREFGFPDEKTRKEVVELIQAARRAKKVEDDN